ncbi:MAG: cation:proton antiporter [Rhodothermales bacterium]
MSESLLFGIASVFMFGIGAQWLAWRFKLPSILLLLIFGFIAGPLTGLLDPQLLTGDLLFPFVALAVGIILFEGGLSLRLNELREVGTAVRNLITVGVLVTWVLSAVGARYLVGFDWSLAIVIGALLTVTGPTVVIPLLRHVRPTGRVGTIAKWEGITIDPVGAILAVLVLETILFLNETSSGASSAFFHAIQGLFLEIVIGVGVSVLGSALLILLLRRRLVPDYLQNPITLMVVIAAFAISDLLQHESGLLATTLMGIIMANQSYVSVRRIVEFKEDLRVLLISVLFIVLTARLELSALANLGLGSFLFLAFLIVIVRPAAVWISSRGTQLNMKEQGFLAWLAPRGIVAAAVASLFAFRLESLGLFPEDTDAIVPVVFLVIGGTVAIYGLTISPLARWMGLAQPNPQGVLILGAHQWAQRIAKVLHDNKFKVLLIDANYGNIRQAQNRGLPAQRANALSESIIDEVDLNGIGRLLALTPNDEVNSLSALHFYEIFESNDIYQITTRSEHQRSHEGELPRHLRGRPLFGSDVTYGSLSDRFSEGGEIETFELTEEVSVEDVQERYGPEGLIPLFLIQGPDKLFVYAGEKPAAEPEPGQKLVALVDPKAEKPAAEPEPEAVATDGADGAPADTLENADASPEVTPSTPHQDPS